MSVSIRAFSIRAFGGANNFFIRHFNNQAELMKKDAPGQPDSSASVDDMSKRIRTRKFFKMLTLAVTAALISAGFVVTGATTAQAGTKQLNQFWDGFEGATPWTRWQSSASGDGVAGYDINKEAYSGRRYRSREASAEPQRSATNQDHRISLVGQFSVAKTSR